MPVPTDEMAAEAQRGLDWRAEYGRGGTAVGVARARDITNKKDLSMDTVQRMASYFARHEVDKQAEGWSPGEDGYPSAGRIAWALWGGDPGRAWAARQLEDERSAKEVPTMANRLRLPDEVLARLGERGLSHVSARSGPHTIEARLWSGAELRASDAGSLRVVGYASTYDQPYPIYGGAAAGGFDEIIRAGAFVKSVREQDDVRFLVNHDGVPLARTRSGTMTLEADDVGLLVDATLDASSPIVAGLRSAMERGDMDQMSFAFEVTRQRWSADFAVREITEVRLHDVSVVTYPANPATLAMVGDQADEAGYGKDDEDDKPMKGRSLRLARADWHRLTGVAQ